MHDPGTNDKLADLSKTGCLSALVDESIFNSLPDDPHEGVFIAKQGDPDCEKSPMLEDAYPENVE